MWAAKFSKSVTELKRPFLSLGEPLISLAYDTCSLLGPTGKDARRQAVGRDRTRVFARHDGRCALCGEIAFDLHHIAAHEEGGPTADDNLLPVCGICHDFAELG